MFWAAIIGLAWVPFWLGSNREIAWIINAGYFGFLTLAYEGILLLDRRPHPVAFRRVAFPALGFLVVCGWIVFQASTWIPFGLQHPLWQWMRDTFKIDVAGSLTINRIETHLALLRLLTAGCVFWLFFQLGRSQRRANTTVHALALIGSIYATYGLIAFFVFPGTLLWFPKEAYLDSVTSTFINRNSYATYAGMGLICAMAAALSEYARQTARAGRSSFRRGAAFLAATAGPAGGWLAAAFVLAMALVQTGSRGGITASIAGVAVLAVLVLMRGRSTTAGMAVLLALMAAGVALFGFGDLLAARLATQGFDASDRLAVYRLTILSIGDAPWLGFGYGTFQSVFPMYRDRSVGVTGIWDKAHNTYLEIFQGMGIPFALLFLSVLAFLAFRCARAALARQSSATAPLVATSATAIVGLHALIDFSMQMQAVALTWTALIAAGIAQSWSGSVDTSVARNGAPKL